MKITEWETQLQFSNINKLVISQLVETWKQRILNGNNPIPDQIRLDKLNQSNPGV